jgi:hypothetical protein
MDLPHPPVDIDIDDDDDEIYRFFRKADTPLSIHRGKPRISKGASLTSSPKLSPWE